MDKSIIIILIILVCLSLFMNTRKQELAENFTIPIGSQWQKISADQCRHLNDRIVDPQKLMDENCNIPDTVKERDAINHGMTCLTNINRTIFNDREKRSWCAAAQGQISDDIGFYSAQSNHVVTNEQPLVPDNSVAIKATLDQVNGTPTKTKTKCSLNNNINYAIVKGDEFMPYNSEKIYSVPQ